MGAGSKSWPWPAEQASLAVLSPRACASPRLSSGRPDASAAADRRRRSGCPGSGADRTDRYRQADGPPAGGPLPALWRRRHPGHQPGLSQLAIEASSPAADIRTRWTPEGRRHSWPRLGAAESADSYICRAPGGAGCQPSMGSEPNARREAVRGQRHGLHDLPSDWIYGLENHSLNRFIGFSRWLPSCLK